MTTINQLSTISTLAGGDKVVVYSNDNGDTRKASVTVLTAYVSENLIGALTDTLVASSYVKVTSCTVANLPAAATVGAGARATVTDATQTLTAGIGATVAGGGANIVPVFSDGTNWKIG
jgi:hypothetical protein